MQQHGFKARPRTSFAVTGDRENLLNDQKNEGFEVSPMQINHINLNEKYASGASNKHFNEKERRERDQQDSLASTMKRQVRALRAPATVNINLA